MSASSRPRCGCSFLLSGTFTATGLELGGKDPGYVRADADLDAAVDGLMDGAMFNSGQCCCGIERIYVHESLYDAFVEKAVAWVMGQRLGNPYDPETTMGPMANTRFAEVVRGQIADAVAQGARALIDPAAFPADDGGAYLAPQVLVDVNHDMRVMREESFGPVVGIMPVKDDDEAVALMNDCDYGLTVSVWTADADAADGRSRPPRCVRPRGFHSMRMTPYPSGWPVNWPIYGPPPSLLSSGSSGRWRLCRQRPKAFQTLTSPP